MRLSALTCVALALRSVSSSNVEENTCSCEERVVETAAGEGAFLDKPLQVAGALYDHVDNLLSHEGTAYDLTGKFDSLAVSANMLYDGLYFPDMGNVWDKITELGPDIQGYPEKLYHHAMAVYPSEKISEFRESVDSVASTATALHQAFKGAAEQCEIPLDSVSEELGNMFRALFEELKEQFPPPGEAPGHENLLDRIEESFLQFIINRGMSEEPLRSHSNSLKSGVQHIVVTIGDLYEQHPQLAWALSCITTGTLFAQGILLTALRIIGFGALGPIKGTAAAWLQGWFFGAAVPGGGWFAVLQRLAMTGAKL
ncbi:hypothetical protein DFH29DRAFT_977940 [Suillus ampliporus]|nr:hypothetical protein DFH29DRAFT_977940 [Suillus ampliporus]